MMNDMMPSVEETITPDTQAQLEHEEWQRECEHEERWAALEAQHGKLYGPLWWAKDVCGGTPPSPERIKQFITHGLSD